MFGLRDAPRRDASADPRKLGGHLYIFITVLLGLMIAGFGAGVALCLRMPPAE